VYLAAGCRPRVGAVVPEATGGSIHSVRVVAKGLRIARLHVNLRRCKRHVHTITECRNLSFITQQLIIINY